MEVTQGAELPTRLTNLGAVPPPPPDSVPRGAPLLRWRCVRILLLFFFVPSPQATLRLRDMMLRRHRQDAGCLLHPHPRNETRHQGQKNFLVRYFALIWMNFAWANQEVLIRLNLTQEVLNRQVLGETRRVGDLAGADSHSVAMQQSKKKKNA